MKEIPPVCSHRGCSNPVHRGKLGMWRDYCSRGCALNARKFGEFRQREALDFARANDMWRDD